MSSRKDSTQQWEQLLAATVERHPEVTSGAMFGMPCAKFGGKAFMGSFDGGAVFKLGEPSRTRALELSGSELFDPSGGRPMREWVVVRPEHQERWAELSEAALDKVKPAK